MGQPQDRRPDPTGDADVARAADRVALVVDARDVADALAGVQRGVAGHAPVRVRVSGASDVVRLDVGGAPDDLTDPADAPEVLRGDAGLLRVGDRVDLISADPQGGDAEVVATDVPVLSLPDTPAETGASGLTGRLVVIGAEPGDVARIADASVRTFVTLAFAH